MIDRFLSRPLLVAAVVAVLSFVVYQFTIAPGVDFIDAGELATVCSTLGIAHPTGYPLFALIGWVFAHLPFSSSVIFRLNEMAAFFTALGGGSIALLASEIFQHWMPERLRSVKHAPKGKVPVKNSQAVLPSPSLANAGALVVGVAAAFSSTWWSQSTAIEVYPIQLFLLPIVLFFLLRMTRKEEGAAIHRDGKLFAAILGLAFANHMTTVLLAPASIYLFFARYGFNKFAWRRILGLAPYFIATLLLYLYLPLRSSQFPIMDWGHPATLPLFLKHVTGGQYKIWMFSSGGEAAKQWAYFWHRVPIEFTFIGGLAAIAGIYGLLRTGAVLRAHLLIFTLLLFFGCLLYSINYSIHDIDSYFLLAYLAVALWIGVGVITLARLSRPSGILGVVVTVAVVIAACEIGLNYGEVDESGNHMVEDYTLNMLNNLPPNAIIFSTQWDFWISGAFYYQVVEKVRPDVLVIDKAMMRDRPWYFEYIRKRSPQALVRVEPELDNFLRYLRAFDLGEPEGNGIAESYAQFTEALVEKNLDRPVFITQEMLDEPDNLFASKMKPVPAGSAYRLLPADSALHVSVPKLQWHDAQYRKRDYYTDELRLMQAVPYAAYGEQQLRLGNTQAAAQFLDAALKFKPDLDAKLDDLPERDHAVADQTNTQFTRIQSLRNAILQPNHK